MPSPAQMASPAQSVHVSKCPASVVGPPRAEELSKVWVIITVQDVCFTLQSRAIGTPLSALLRNEGTGSINAVRTVIPRCRMSSGPSPPPSGTVPALNCRRDWKSPASQRNGKAAGTESPGILGLPPFPLADGYPRRSAATRNRSRVAAPATPAAGDTWLNQGRTVLAPDLS